MNALTTEAWQWLKSELDNWADLGKSVNFWWRDDDAFEPSGNLDKLLELSYIWNAPLALAVIPSRLEPELINFLQDRTLVSVMQHGYAHDNHAAPGQRKLELGGTRTAVKIIADLERGYQILQQHFPDRFQTVLVPPWNRIDDNIVSRLPELGFIGISNMRVRSIACPVSGLLQVNTHLDPINWRHRGGFIGVYPAIAILIQHLIAKRTGYRDSAEPTGLLTHHLAQNQAVWRFLEDLLECLCNHPAVTWQSAPDIWQ